MAFSFKKNFPTATTYKKPIVDNDSGETLTSGKDYDVLSNSETLAEAGLQTEPSANNGVQEASNSVFESFGISVVGQSSDSGFNILSGDDLETDDTETLLTTSDDNPNLAKADRYNSLKPRKVSASKIFNQRADNPINEPDECQPVEYKTRKPQKTKLPDIVEEAYDFGAEVQEELTQAYGNNL